MENVKQKLKHTQEENKLKSRERKFFILILLSIILITYIKIRLFDIIKFYEYYIYNNVFQLQVIIIAKCYENYIIAVSVYKL